MALPKETKQMEYERVGARAKKEFQNKPGHLDIKTGIIGNYHYIDMKICTMQLMASLQELIESIVLAMSRK